MTDESYSTPNDGSSWLPVVLAILITSGVIAYGYYKYSPPIPEPTVVPAVAADVVPCDHRALSDDKKQVTYKGPGYMHRKDGKIASHCRPCEKAKSAEEKFVCEGDVE